jgi:hypothetical protein
MESHGTAIVANDALSHDHISGIKVGMLPRGASTPQYYDNYARLMEQGQRNPGKKGHTCCGCCCDVRRAVIVINLVAGTYWLMIVQWIFANLARIHGDYSTTHGFNIGAILFMNCLDLIPVAMGLFGAIYYNGWLIGVAALHYTLQCLYYCNVLLDAAYVMTIPIDMLPAMPVVMALFAYPHFVLISEISGGIMSRENYENEQRSCCCV